MTGTLRPVEVELKYRVLDLPVVERYLSAASIGPFVGASQARSRQIEDRYVDTPTRAFERAGFAVRLRSSGTGAIVSVKSRAHREGAGGAITRDEIEGPAIRAAGPADWPASDARSLVLELAGDAPLVEVVTVRQLRRSRQLRDGSTRVELSLDEVDVVVSKRVITRFVELEAELLRGDEARLRGLAMTLDQDAALRRSMTSKFETALAAVRGTPAEDDGPDGDGPGVPVMATDGSEAAAAGSAGEVKAAASAEPAAPDGSDSALAELEPRFVTGEPVGPDAALAADEDDQGEAAAAGDVEAGEEADATDVETAVLEAASDADLEEAAVDELHEVEIAGPDEEGDREAAETDEELEAAEELAAAGTDLEPATIVGAEIAEIDGSAATATPPSSAATEPVVSITETPAPAPESDRTTLQVSKTPGVTADDHVAEAGRKLMRFHLARMLAREPGTREGKDPEELHAMRVATRRQRAAWRVFGASFRQRRTRRYRSGLREVAGRLGAVRDLDVLLEAADHYRADRPATEQRALEPLLADWRDHREVARVLLVRELDSDGYQRWVDDYRDFVRTEGAAVLPVGPVQPHRVRDVMPSRIWTAYEAVRAYEPVLRWADVETLHDLRIAGKWLRYTLEFVREALGPDAGPLIERVTALQDHLGLMHDADVTASMARAFLVEHAGELSSLESAAIGRYLVDREREVTRLRRTLAVTWRSVDSLAYRRALGRVVAGL